MTAPALNSRSTCLCVTIFEYFLTDHLLDPPPKVVIRQIMSVKVYIFRRWRLRSKYKHRHTDFGLFNHFALSTLGSITSLNRLTHLISIQRIKLAVVIWIPYCKLTKGWCVKSRKTRKLSQVKLLLALFGGELFQKPYAKGEMARCSKNTKTEILY